MRNFASVMGKKSDLMLAKLGGSERREKFFDTLDLKCARI